VSGTLGKVPKILGKGFAECYTRQRALDSEYSGKDVFAECLLSGTRQRKVAVTAFGTVTALCRAPSGWRSAKTGPLPSAYDVALGKGPSLCRAPSARRSAKADSLPSACYVALGKADKEDGLLLTNKTEMQMTADKHTHTWTHL
jgi:hypothetical protein